MQTQIATHKAHQADIEVYEYVPKREYVTIKICYKDGAIRYEHKRPENVEQVLLRFDGVEL